MLSFMCDKILFFEADRPSQSVLSQENTVSKSPISEVFHAL